MSLIDAEAGTERFGGYEAELKLVQADLSQQLDEIPELTGEPRKAAISKAERALEEANELVSWCLFTLEVESFTELETAIQPRPSIHYPKLKDLITN